MICSIENRMNFLEQFALSQFGLHRSQMRHDEFFWQHFRDDAEVAGNVFDTQSTDCLDPEFREVFDECIDDREQAMPVSRTLPPTTTVKRLVSHQKATL
jgi:hypothetical protein